MSMLEHFLREYDVLTYGGSPFMKTLLTLGAAALLSIALALPAQAELPKRPDGPVKMQLTKKPVVFSHAIHARSQCEGCHVSTPQHFPPMSIDRERMCMVCHHEVEGSAPPTFACTDCHNVLDPQDKSTSSYFRIAHARNLERSDRVSCLSCHFDVIKTRPEKTVALTSCVGSACHPQ